MFGLQRLEFAHQAVVLDVRDVRLVEDVVAMVGVVDQAAQFGDAGGGFGGHCGILGHRVWWMRALAWYSRLEWQAAPPRSEEHTSELQSLMRISYAVFCLKKKTKKKQQKAKH